METCELYAQCQAIARTFLSCITEALDPRSRSPAFSFPWKPPLHSLLLCVCTSDSSCTWGRAVCVLLCPAYFPSVLYPQGLSVGGVSRDFPSFPFQFYRDGGKRQPRVSLLDSCPLVETKTNQKKKVCFSRDETCWDLLSENLQLYHMAASASCACRPCTVIARHLSLSTPSSSSLVFQFPPVPRPLGTAHLISRSMGVTGSLFLFVCFFF